MWVNKGKPNGLVKARFSALGFSRPAGSDFGSTCARVCRNPSVRIVLAIGANKEWDVIQLDVQTAFLQSRRRTKYT